MPVSDRGEQGSLVIALLVILILSGLSIAILARTLSALGATRRAQDTASATSEADAGVADAVYVLDHTSITGGESLTSLPSASFHWTATLTDPFSGTLTSTGTANGRTHTVTVPISRPPWVVVTAGSLVIDGTDVITETGALSEPAPRLGAGGALVLRNLAAGGAGQDLLGPGASCAGCSAPAVVPATLAMPDPQPPTPPSAPCGTISAIAPGPLVCTGPLVFSGAVPAPLAPADIYVVGGGITFAGAVVGAGGDPSLLTVHLVGAGTIDPGTGPASSGPAGAGSFTGILDAPRATMRSDDCEFNLIGAAELGSLDCLTVAPGPGPSLTLDSRASVPADGWQTGSYQDTGGS